MELGLGLRLRLRLGFGLHAVHRGEQGEERGEGEEGGDAECARGVLRTLETFLGAAVPAENALGAEVAVVAGDTGGVAVERAARARLVRGCSTVRECSMVRGCSTVRGCSMVRGVAW